MKLVERSAFLRGSLGAIGCAVGGIAAPGLVLAAQSAEASFARIEKRYGGGLGVSSVDLQTGNASGYRQDERFAMCSTFKFFLVADILARIDAGSLHRDQWIVYRRGDLIAHSPVTGAHVANGGMPLIALCAAAMEQSDNTAANLLLALVGGPKGATQYLRRQGDDVTRLDRWEPHLNEALPGDPRDTTTPAAMRKLMASILFGPALRPSSSRRLESWMIANKTGLDRLRAGLPRPWKAGDKTGSGDNGATNDIAVACPPGRKAILIAAYYSGPNLPYDQRVAVLREVGRTVTLAFIRPR
jgi:beta-lactamase class A